VKARLLAFVLAGCTHALPPPTPPVSAPAPPPPIWPITVRVMTWSAVGPVQLGELPDHPPASYPALWYVEPEHRVDAAMLGKLVVALRREHVPGLSLRGQPVAAMLGELRELPELHALILDDTDVDGAALAATGLALTRLYVARTGIDDAALAAIAPRQRGLEVLGAEACPIGDAGARALAQLTHLRAIDLDDTQLGDAGGEALGAIASLRIVDFGHTHVGPRTIAALRRLPLDELFLDGSTVGGELAELAPLAPTLARFDASALAHHAPTDREVGWLANAPNLIEVGLDGAMVHDPLVHALVALPGLREIRLAGAPITLAEIRELVAHPELEEVDLAHTPIDNAAAAQLFATATMRVLRLDQTAIGDAALAGAPSPALRELYVSHTGVGDAGLAVLDALPELEALGLADDPVGDATVHRIAHLVHLHTLVADGVRAGSLAELGALHGLERIYLENTPADDAVIAALAPLAGLRVLHLANTQISDASLATLRSFERLEELTLGGTNVDGKLGDLASWPRLHTLSAYGLPLDDAAVAALAHRRSLVALDLSGTAVRELAPLEALPHLQLLGLAETRLAATAGPVLARLHAKGVDIER
jgi:hypothetical protein